MGPTETARLTLRGFRDEDVDPLFAIQGDREAMRFTHAASSRQDCAHWLRTFAALESTRGFAPWTVILQTEARVIGWGGLSIDPFDPGWGIEVSYFFHPAYWGRGYATELVRATLQHGFGTLSLPAIGAFVRPANLASVRVLEKCGLRGWATSPGWSGIAMRFRVLHGAAWPHERTAGVTSAPDKGMEPTR